MSSDKKEKNIKPIGGGLFFYVIMIVVLIAFSTIVFGGNYGQKEQKTLSDVMTIIDDENNKVSLVEIKGTTVVVSYRNAAGINDLLEFFLFFYRTSNVRELDLVFVGV